MQQILKKAPNRVLIGEISLSKVARMAHVAFILPLNQPSPLFSNVKDTIPFACERYHGVREVRECESYQPLRMRKVSEYMFQLIKYKSNLLALNLRSSKYRLKTWVKYDSFTWCLTHTELYYFSKKAQKHVLRLEIDSLRPKDTFPYPGYISRTIRTTLKNHSKSSPWFLLYFTFRKASKGPK